MYMRTSLSMGKHVAIAMWKVATPDCYWSVGSQFGVGRSIIRAVAMVVCTTIKKVLSSWVISLGNVQVTINGFV